MSKIGDLWVRLGLKKDSFDKGIDSAGKGLKGLLLKMTALSSVFSHAWESISKAAAKVATDTIRLTQKFGDQFSMTMDGIKGAYSAFIRQISSGDGWNNLFANMRESYRIAKEVSAALDEIFERQNSYDYTEAITEREIARLDLIRRNTSLTDAEREAAAKKIIELEEQLGRERKSIAQQTADANRKLFKDQTKMNDEEIDFLIRNYNKNRDIIEQGRQYLEDRKKAEKAAKRNTAASMTADLEGVAADLVEANVNRANNAVAELDATTSQAVKDVAELLKKYDRSSDELVQNLAQAEIAVIKVDTDVARASARATSTIGSLNRVSSSSSVTESPKDVWGEYVQGIQDAARAAASEAADIAAAEAEINAGFDSMVESFREMKGLTEEKPQDNWWDAFTEGIADAADAAAEQEQRLIDIAKDFNANVAEGIADGCQEIMDSLMGLEQFNAGGILKALLTPLADMAVQEGKILIASGIGIEAVKKALESLNGIAAVAAGAALIAIGTAAKSGLSALAQSGASSTTATTSGYSGGGSWQQALRTEMTIYVTGKISGNDIEISGERTLNNWSR